MNAARTAGHLAEKLAAPHHEDSQDGTETELAAALGGITLLAAAAAVALVIVAFKLARSLL